MLASRGPAFRGPPKTTSCRARRAIQLHCNTATALSFVHDSESFWAKRLDLLDKSSRFPKKRLDLSYYIGPISLQ